MPENVDALDRLEYQSSRHSPLPSGDSGVSVIIPAYDCAHCLRRAILNALEQTLPPLEVIVIDDGSEDETATVARSFGRRIRFRQQANQGQGAARNTGLQLAAGQFIAFLDADDFWLPGFIAACIDFLRTHPEVIAVSTGLCFRTLRGIKIIGPNILSALPEGNPRPWVLTDFFAFWGRHNHIRTGACVIRREIIEKAGYQQAHLRMSQDLEYWGYLATFGLWGLSRRCTGFATRKTWPRSMGGSKNIDADAGYAPVSRTGKSASCRGYSPKIGAGSK